MITYGHCWHCKKEPFGCPEEEERRYHQRGCGYRSCSGNRPHVKQCETDAMPNGNGEDRMRARFFEALETRKK